MSEAALAARTAHTGARTVAPLALYIHWPFCVSKCPYCDFNSHVRDAVDQIAWREAMLADLAHEARVTGRRRLGSIFFGGGTPSLMDPDTVAALIDAAAGHWQMDPDIEITLEANPSSVEASRFADIAAAGVNRVSLGLQSLDDNALRFLGRAHDAAEGLAALDVAQSVFARVSFDLIYALPGQDEQAWAAELSRALAFGTGHLSLYQLTIEPGTRFAAMAAKGELESLDPDHGACLYEVTQELAATAGRPAYEISNHARLGEESRHNLAYWRYQDYCGIGPGAHGRRTGMMTQRHRKPENWLASVERRREGIVEEKRLSPRDRGIEALLMGLRLGEGIDLASVAQMSGLQIAELIDQTAAARLADQGLIKLEGTRVRATPSGLLLLDGVLREIVRV
jgi:putative oxygen-independent coproporphyrinogen III oxidase